MPDPRALKLTTVPGAINAEPVVLAAPHAIPGGLLVTLPAPDTETLSRTNPAVAVTMFDQSEQPASFADDMDAA